MKLATGLIIGLLFTSACKPLVAEQQAIPITLATPTKTSTVQLTHTFTSAPSMTGTNTKTNTATVTITPTITETATITSTATFDFPEVTVHTQAHCRYGPSSAYLHAADLYPGDTGQVRGRYVNSKWLHVKFDKLNYWCWVSPSVIDIVGDISTVRFIEPNLQSIGSNMYGPPQNVQATRNGDQVVISWSQMNMTEDKDRGYFIEAWVCQNGAYLWWTISFPDQYTTSYTVLDQDGCAYPSSGVIYTVEKHGYSQPVTILWP
ncbi:MAG: hypothetical protein BGO78_17635 [Chloroflexi bacterium 44-23]|nr:MAG: hypothetical protein BGO78_17635 [Chloroflexi bacterium 44-23]